MTRLPVLGMLLIIPTVLTAQEFGVAAHVGTLGIGADVGVAVHPRVTARVGGNFFPVNPSITVSDIKYTADFPSPQFTGMVDVFLVGGLRLSGGLRISGDDAGATGEITGSVDIGNATYTAAEVGTLTAVIETNTAAPYIGIGFGNVARPGPRFFLDAGVAFQGRPAVTFSSDGTLASDPLFQAELVREAEAAEDDIELFRFYPVLSLGVAFGF
ncbi:MAG: hypothetical protein OER90_05240 [Gemmatimonadota bacterium]|nr:hypothetical protein [Gemmatimonadota bacterium]